MGAALDIRDLAVSLSDEERRFTLRVDALRVAPGETVGLSGPSGTGKTLLLELLGLLRRPDAGGRYTVTSADGARDLAGLWSGGNTAPEIARARGSLFGFVPQSGGLLPFLSVAQNVAMSQRVSGRVDRDWAGHLLDRLGLSRMAGALPGTLSIGQRQRVSIARALAHRPPFVIADEPTAALDPDNAAEAMALLFGAAAEGGAAVILSSHDMELLSRYPMTRYGLAAETGVGGQVTSRLAPLAREAA